MSIALYGQIIHRLKLPESSSDVPVSRKRQRATTSTKQNEELNDQNHHNLSSSGFVFVPNQNSPCQHHHHKYLLSLPKDVLKTACDAVLRKQEIVLRKYTELFMEDWSTTTMSSSSSSETMTSSMLEVHSGGLEILPSCNQQAGLWGGDNSNSTYSGSGNSNDGHRNDNHQQRDDFWTLTQFWRKELVDFKAMQQTSSSSSSRPKFDILGTVDAITPVVAMDPFNPFALIEVYDKDNTDITSIIVLKGSQALACHSAIFPLDTLVFRNVTYKPWTIPKILRDDASMDQNLLKRIPSHVFVVTDDRCVSWNYCDQAPIKDCTQRQQTHERSQQQRPRPIPSIITPVNLVTIIMGKILHVNTVSLSSGRHNATVIQYLDMISLAINDDDDDDDTTCDNKNNASGTVTTRTTTSRSSSSTTTLSRRCRLYLSHFPMSAALQWSLRKDAIVQANNIHLILRNESMICSDDDHSQIYDDSHTYHICDTWITYGACLRSTLLLVESAAAVTGRERIQDTQEGGDFLYPKESLRQSDKSSSLRLETQETGDSLQRRRQNGMTMINAFPSPLHHDSSCPGTNMESPWLEYGFWKIRETYLQYIYHQHVEKWVRHNFRGSLHSKSSGGNCNSGTSVPISWVVNVILRLSQPANPSDSSKLKRCRPLPRSPYAEFFDHPYTLASFDQDAVNYLHNNPCGCHLSIQDRHGTSSIASVLIGLNEIRTACQGYIAKQILTVQSMTQSTYNTNCPFSTPLHTGWSGSVCITPHELLSKQKNCKDGKESGANMRIYQSRKIFDYFVGGFVSDLDTTSSKVWTISDGACQLPADFSQNEKKPYARINDFVLGQVINVMISCLCLGSPPRDKHMEKTTKSQSLQDSLSSSASLPALYSNNTHLLGGCSLVSLCGFLFVTAIQIECREHQVFSNDDVACHGDTEKQHEEFEFVPIEQILSTAYQQQFHSSSLKGMLTRRRFQCNLNTDGTYKCCRLTLSSLLRDEALYIENDGSCLQTLELSLSFVQNTGRMLKFSQKLDSLWPGVNLSEAQKVLGSSFWALGDSGRTFPLTVGGCEDLVPGSYCSDLIVHILFPHSSLKVSNLGFLRASCTHDQIEVSFTRFKREEYVKQSTNNERSISFDFVGGLKVFSGMLHRRPQRRNIPGFDDSSVHVVGELNTTPSTAIPVCTLSQLYESIYHHLREPSASTMHPSLVRRVTCSHLLGISFCQVQCWCMRCYSPLMDISCDTKQGRLSAKQGRQNWHEYFHEPSFWHLPHPEEKLLCALRTQSSTTNGNCDVPSHTQRSTFRCPNQCPMRIYGVKWECSGILDDGTGQATMYADGDAAVTLLGMSAESIQCIEEGIWSVPGGSLLFKKSIPPSKQLRDKIHHLLARKTNVAEPIQLLPVNVRAEYLLESHCRSSSRPRRPLDYYVRCKPLPDKFRHLQHTTVDSFFVNGSRGGTIFRGEVTSYTLPPLKLELVDCGIPSMYEREQS